jgi:nucleoside-diphosphate-sugar epimerase
VIHCAFDHSAFGGDFSKFLEVCEKDRRAIEALGDPLRGSDRPLVITSGTGMGTAVSGQPAIEDHFDRNHPHPRKASELAADSVAERGVNVSVVRLPQVHDTLKQGLITQAVQVARAKGVSAYIGEGVNRWPAAHVLDVARLYRLALEKHEPGSRYNAVAEEGVSLKEIAHVIGRGLNVPVVSLSYEQAQAHFGWLAMFAGSDMPASSAQTRQRLGWHPSGPGLIADLGGMDYTHV